MFLVIIEDTPLWLVRTWAILPCVTSGTVQLTAPQPLYPNCGVSLYSAKTQNKPIQICGTLFLSSFLLPATLPYSLQQLQVSWTLIFVSSIQYNHWGLHGTHFPAPWPGVCLRVESQGHLRATFSQGSQFHTTCCPKSENSCFIYFIQFSSCSSLSPVAMTLFWLAAGVSETVLLKNTSDCF